MRKKSPLELHSLKKEKINKWGFYNNRMACHSNITHEQSREMVSKTIIAMSIKEWRKSQS